MNSSTDTATTTATTTRVLDGMWQIAEAVAKRDEIDAKRRAWRRSRAAFAAAIARRIADVHA